MSEYSYNNEPIDLRTMNGLNQYLFDPHLQRDPQDEDEGNTEISTRDSQIQDLSKELAQVREMLAQFGVQVPNNALSNGSANQVTTPTTSSPDPVIQEPPSPVMAHQFSFPSDLTPSYEHPDFLPQSPGGVSQPSGSIFIPGYSDEPPYNVLSRQDTPPQEGLWEQVLKVLQEAAALEMAGVVIYSFYTQVLNGVEGKVLAELFRENATESASHFAQVTDWMLRVQGGRAYVRPDPTPEEMADIPFLRDMDIEEYSKKLNQLCLDKAIRHETKAVECYYKLYSLVRGKDTPLEQWSSNQVQVETQDLVKFKQYAGLL